MSKFAPNISRREAIGALSAVAAIVPGAAAPNTVLAQEPVPTPDVPAQTVDPNTQTVPVLGTPDLVTPQDVANCYKQWEKPGVVTTQLKAKVGRKTVEATVTIKIPGPIKNAANNAELDCNEITPVSVWHAKKQRVAKKSGQKAAKLRVRYVGKSQRTIPTSSAVKSQETDTSKLVATKKVTFKRPITKKQVAKRTNALEQQVVPVPNEQAIKNWNPNFDMSQVPAAPTIRKTYWIGKDAVRSGNIVYASHPPKRVGQAYVNRLLKKCNVFVSLAPGTPGGDEDRKSPYFQAWVEQKDGKKVFSYELDGDVVYCGGIVYDKKGAIYSFEPTRRTKDWGELVDPANGLGNKAFSQVVFFGNSKKTMKASMLQ